MSEFLARNQNRIVGAAMAAGIATGAIGLGVGASEIFGSSEPQYDPTATAPCNTLPQSQVDTMAQRLQGDYDVAHNLSTGPRNDFSALYAGTPLGATKLNLHLATSDIPTVTPDMDAHKAGALLSDFTNKEYGFPVITHPETWQTAADATNLEYLLSRMPTELVKAAHVSSIEIDATLLPGEAGNFDPRTDQIHLGPGETKGIGHEIDHAAAKQSAIKHCGASALKLGDPNLIADNPATFTYDATGEDIAWQQVTATRYGAYTSAEDGAEISETMIEPSTGDSCIYDRSPVINAKVADVAARFNDLAPNSGTFIVDAMFVARACA